MPVSRLQYLFNCYVQNKFTVPEEEEEFMELLTQPESQAEVQKLINHVMENTGSEMQMNEQVTASILNSILQKGERLIIPRSTN